jgi:3-isopropylmalate/(R)-2-methylmalate dehydratase small subunit
MAGLQTLTAVAAPLALDNLDTDQIFPARFSSKDRRDGKFGSYFLHDLRFDRSGGRNADFVLNDARLENSKILVASANYACGSGRAGAIFSHVDFGIRAIIAESFGAVFSSVAYKSGLLTVQLARGDVALLRAQLSASIGAELTIDLPNQVVIAPDGQRFHFEIDRFVKRLIMEGISEVDLTLGMRDKIEQFDVRRRTAMPWLFAPRD